MQCDAPMNAAFAADIFQMGANPAHLACLPSYAMLHAPDSTCMMKGFAVMPVVNTSFCRK